MIKKISLFAAVIFMAITANAQIKLIGGVGLAMPMGDFADVAKTGFGINVGGKYMLNEKMAVGANLGYFMMGEEIDGVKISVMPIMGSFTYYFGSEGFKPYAGVDLGFYSSKAKYDDNLGMDDDSETDFGFAPTVGFEYGFSDNLALDVNAKYNYINSDPDAQSFIGINVGIVYTLK